MQSRSPRSRSRSSVREPRSRKTRPICRRTRNLCQSAPARWASSDCPTKRPPGIAFSSQFPAGRKWRGAITSVVISSLQGPGINVDNSQIILSSDESRSYRLILTTATKYFDNSREFNLYFVEALKREEYGDRNTTLLLKGLELVCRYRFLFLERDSKFSADNVLITRAERLPEI